MVVHQRGMATTHVRDLLHIGTGVWLLGLKFWNNPQFPILITGTACLMVIVLPLLGDKWNELNIFLKSVSDQEEKWTGIALYVVSYTLFTALGVLYSPFPAVAGLVSLSLGDGLGGFIGRKYGRRTYRFPWAKTKSYLGSAAVFSGSLGGIILGALWFEVPLNLWLFPTLAAVATLVEAAAPRSSDNLLIPLSVFGVWEVLS